MLNQHNDNDSTTNHKPSDGTWWREAQEEIRTPLRVVAPQETDEVFLPEARDIGDELEEEARQQARFVGIETTIPIKLGSIYQKLSRLGIILQLFLAIFATGLNTGLLVSHNANSAGLFTLGFIWISFITGSLFLRWQEKRFSSGSILLSKTGITAVLPGITCGPIYWDEISNIRTSLYAGVSYICITPRDRNALVERLTGDVESSSNQDARSKRNFIRSAFSRNEFALGADLPMPTEVFMAQIAAMRNNPSDMQT